MITISKNAQKYLISILSHEAIGTQIRVFILHPGTQHAECGLAFCQENEIDELDIQLKYNKFFVYVNKDIMPYLKNTVIDLITDQISSQLTLKAPYAKKNYLITQTSSLQERIQNFLSIEINSQLAMHGGQVNLVKLDKHGTAIIKFSGGCNGCAMIASTVKETVEKKLLSSFSEIKKVCDATEHVRGQHSFY